MRAKIRVTGKDQNRMALGIVNAYVKLNPNANLETLQKAFPETLNTSGSGEVVVSLDQAKKHPTNYFLEPNELIQLKNGTQVAVKYTWIKDDYEAIVERAKEFGIKSHKLGETAPFKEGSYKLELIEEKPCVDSDEIEIVVIEDITPYGAIIDIIEVEKVNPKKPISHATEHDRKENTKKTPLPPVKKKKNNLIWWILALVLLFVLLLFGWKCCKNDKTKKVVVIEQVEEKAEESNYKSKLASAKIDASGDLKYDKSGKLVAIVLDGETINVDSYATEAEVYNFLLSDKKQSEWIVLDEVHFNFNEVNFTEKGLKQIRHIVSILKKWDSKAKIEIEGFADHIGTDAENQWISNERAKQTANHFINEGFNNDNIISAIGLKDTKRLCTADDTPACRLVNRRAEIRITK